MVRSWALALALVLAPLSSWAATSARCTALGSSCDCDEPLDTNTVVRNSGAPSFNTSTGAWPGSVPSDQRYIDPSDSLDVSGGGKECGSWETGYPDGLSVYNETGTSIEAVTAASQAAFLPAGNTLSFVVKRTGLATGKVVGRRVTGSPGTTWCIGHYRRWDTTSDTPDRVRCDSTPPGSGAGGGCSEDTVIKSGTDLDISPVCAAGCVPYHEQYKVQTIAGQSYGWQQRTDVDFSAGHADHGALAFGSQGGLFGDPTPAGGPVKNGSDIITQGECTNNFCYIETCFDYLSNTKAQVRYRARILPPGTPKTFTSTPVISSQTPNGIGSLDASSDANNFNDVEFFAQSVTPGGVAIVYVTHAIFIKASLDQTLWPGCDPAVEPTCNAATGDVSGTIITPNSLNGGGDLKGGGEFRTGWLERIMLYGWRSVLLPPSVGG